MAVSSAWCRSARDDSTFAFSSPPFSQRSRSSHTHTEYLSLSDNEFISAIDTRIGSLTSLAYLDLSRNLITGEVPSTIQRLTNLKEYHSPSNVALHGPILDYALKWINLQGLDISETDVSGTIPTGKRKRERATGRCKAAFSSSKHACFLLILKELGMLTKLTALSFWSTLLSGTIPSELGQLVALGTMQASKKRKRTRLVNRPPHLCASIALLL